MRYIDCWSQESSRLSSGHQLIIHNRGLTAWVQSSQRWIYITSILRAPHGSGITHISFRHQSNQIECHKHKCLLFMLTTHFPLDSTRPWLKQVETVEYIRAKMIVQKNWTQQNHNIVLMITIVCTGTSVTKQKYHNTGEEVTRLSGHVGIEGAPSTSWGPPSQNGYWLYVRSYVQWQNP